MRQGTRVDYEARIEDTLVWLQAHHTEPVSPMQLAKIAHFSPYHFHRVFRGMTGESVMQCVRRLRLESAALALRRSRASVIEVALQVGFRSHEGFTRAFRSHFGAPPSVWRDQVSSRLEELSERAPVEVPAVELRQSGSVPFLYLHKRGAVQDVGPAWRELVELLVARGLFTGAERLVGRYPDDPEITPPGKLRFDVGLVSDDTGPGLRNDTLPAGWWAVALHKGSYSTLSDTYLKLVGGWFPESGRALANRPCIEWYLNSPSNTPEEELLTEVWAPLAPRAA